MSGRLTPDSGTGRPVALVILVGITATHRQRRNLAAYFSAHSNLDVYLPFIPYVFGLQASGLWLRHVLNRKVFSQGHKSVHFVNFIGGGYVFRSVCQALKGRPIGRIVYIRSPIQEEIPRVLARRLTQTGLLLSSGKMLVDLSTDWIRDLPFPQTCHEQGLVIETEISRAAMSLGLGKDAVPPADWDHDVLLPGADDVIEVPVSHDEVYDSEEVLAQILRFVEYGRFSTTTRTSFLAPSLPPTCHYDP